MKNATASSEGIVSNVISVVSKKGTTYKCVYSYTTKTGKQYVCENAKSTKPALYDIGDKVVLQYNPSEPEKAAPNSIMGTWLLPFAFSFVGLCVIIGGMWLIKLFGE